MSPAAPNLKAQAEQVLTPIAQAKQPLVTSPKIAPQLPAEKLKTQPAPTKKVTRQLRKLQQSRPLIKKQSNFKTLYKQCHRHQQRLNP